MLFFVSRTAHALPMSTMTDHEIIWTATRCDANRLFTERCCFYKQSIYMWSHLDITCFRCTSQVKKLMGNATDISFDAAGQVVSDLAICLPPGQLGKWWEVVGVPVAVTTVVHVVTVWDSLGYTLVIGCDALYLSCLSMCYIYSQLYCKHLALFICI